MSQDKDWVSVWERMPADTNKVRYLYAQIREFSRFSPDSLILLASQGHILARTLGDDYGEALMLASQGLGHSLKGEYKASIPFFSQANDLYIDLGKHKKSGGTLTNLGLTYYFLGQEDQALHTYLQAAEQFSKAQEPNSSLYNNIAIIYRKKKKYDRAIAFYEQSLTLKQAKQDTIGMANVWFNLANLYLYQQDTLQGIHLAQQALYAYEAAHEEANIASAHALLSVLYRRTGLLDTARQELEAAWSYYHAHSKEAYYLICLSEFAYMHHREENWPQAIQFYGEAIQVSYDRQAESDRYLLLKHLSALLADRGHMSAAYDSLLKSYALRETLTASKRLEVEEEMQARFEVQQAEQREQIQAQAFAKEQAQSRIIMFLIGFLLLGVVVFLIVNVRKNSRLRLKQHQVEQALVEKEAIMREMHHRIKNNLQFLSSLLRLQARDLDDAQARDALLHSRSRVLSMALIHKHLYEDGGRTAIRMDAYLEKLTQDVLGSLSQPDRQIDFQLHADPLILDVDRAIPVALITHEAIVNAMKYAFEGRETGNLSVSLTSTTKNAQLQIQDDGIGTQTAQQGFGQRLIHLLAERLAGSLAYVSDAGFRLSLDFPLSET